MAKNLSNTLKEVSFRAGGEMAELINNYNWFETSLGDPDAWPQSLKTTLNIILYSKFPMFLWWGSDLICFYNDAYRPTLGINGKHPDILGKPCADAWPEIWVYIKPLIDQIMGGGESVFNEDMLLPIYRNGEMENAYWTFSYSPVKDESGTVQGVLVICNETTQKVNLLQHLQLSDRRFQSLIRGATVGIIVVTGPECIIEIVNEAYCNLIERTDIELLGQPLFKMVPETATELLPVIEKVRLTGQSKKLYEHPYLFYKNGIETKGHLDIFCQPYKEIGNEITGVMILCQDVTEQVQIRRAVVTTLEQLRLSKEAAQLGMFDMDLEKGTMEWDNRCRTLFGISHTAPVTYEKDFVHGLHHEDRQRITKIIDSLFIKSVSNGDYDVEYRTVGAEDGRVRWVRAKGKVYFNSLDKPVRFIGSVLDITPEKVNETRKNDFIAMVSHELKTPLTSLTAYIQILLSNAKQESISFDAELLGRANVQAKKMSNLINGFLNLSRLESGKLDLYIRKFSVDKLIRSAIDDVAMGKQDTPIEFLPCGEMLVSGDSDKIESVIINFLSNALKYSPKGGKIIVACEIQENSVVVSVKDQGIGINANDIPYIFERFYRIDSDRTKDISGFGIGLFLSAEIVRLHGGKIWVESEYGVGSTFYFSIPLSL